MDLQHSLEIESHTAGGTEVCALPQWIRFMREKRLRMFSRCREEKPLNYVDVCDHVPKWLRSQKHVAYFLDTRRHDYSVCRAHVALRGHARPVFYYSTTAATNNTTLRGT